eukprot:TRINITY_DN29713_c0_g1_i1.p1 TRINITY_DN29713_c0_g1~~TRINITY_DN29713_c0_g1_i1.p1  ORF type:complete len:580 (+),score=96.10 TRINITY_DN29713_c0_g1_i1:143-1882(+)
MLRMQQELASMQSSQRPGPPLLETAPCSSLREAGRQHGTLAASRIQSFLQASEIAQVLAFVAEPAGASVLADLRDDNTAAFPQYAEEIAGIAEGAQVVIDAIWAVNLLAELQALMGLPIGQRSERCSDVILRGNGTELWHGHNEDWSRCPDWHETIYFVRYNALPAASFVPVMGFCYPGMIPGFAMTWSANGIVFTQNSLFPPSVRRRGLGCTFVPRRAGEESSLERALQWLVAPGQALGCSVNLVELPKEGKPPRACNVEVYGVGPSASVTWLEGTLGSTLIHCNIYLTLNVGNANNPRNSCMRQARAAQLLAAAPGKDGGAANVQAVLADIGKKDSAFPIYGPTTMCSWLLDLSQGLITVWARGRPGHAQPLHIWELADFFQKSSRSASIPSSPVLLAKAEPPAETAAPLPLQNGVHKADLWLRQAVSKGMQEALKSSRNSSVAMAEVSALRKELLKKVRIGELNHGEVVQAFQNRLAHVLQIWPLQSAESSPASSKAQLESKLHEVDLVLRKAVGHALKREDCSCLLPEQLLSLRRKIVHRVRNGDLATGDAVAAFGEGVSDLLTQLHETPSFLGR